MARAAYYENKHRQTPLSIRVAAWWAGFKRRHVVSDWPFGGDMQ